MLSFVPQVIRTTSQTLQSCSPAHTLSAWKWRPASLITAAWSKCLFLRGADFKGSLKLSDSGLLMRTWGSGTPLLRSASHTCGEMSCTHKRCRSCELSPTFTLRNWWSTLEEVSGLLVLPLVNCDSGLSPAVSGPPSPP